jgi:hypothetical protein
MRPLEARMPGRRYAGAEGRERRNTGLTVKGHGILAA